MMRDVSFYKKILGIVILSATVFSSTGYTTETASIKIRDVLARPVNISGSNGAGYLTIENSSNKDDTLLRIESNISQAVEIHAMITRDTVMKMRKLESAYVPAQGELVFSRGGNHIMFVKLKDSLKKGDMFPIVLVFKHAGSITVTMRVEE
jgi:copper(I)-binding protein